MMPMRYLDQLPIIGIIRGAETDSVQDAVRAALAGGMRTLEITLNHPKALDQIALINEKYSSEIELGVGTVLDVDSAEKAVAAGAQFIVTPALLPAVIQYCKDNRVPVFPGAMTPTEVLAAHRAGADMVKVFPASSLGPGYIKSLKGPFPDVKLMPTGGVTVESVQQYFQSGASALGIGSELFKKDWLLNGDWKSVENRAGEYVRALKEAL